MRRHTKTIVAGLATALIVSASALPAFAQTDDQARLDAVIDAFDQRMTDAGWVGSPVEEEGDDEEVDDEGDTTIGDDEFDECFGELAAVFEGSMTDDEFPGQTGLRESREFTFAPEGSVPETTEEFSFEFGDEETVAAVALSVDESSTELLDTFVDIIGAKETGECMREAMEADMASDTTEEGVPPAEFEFTVENAADLGVGDRSARLQFGMEADFFGMAFVFDIDMYLARSDRDLVMLIHGTVGEAPATSGLDPLAELQTLVDSL